MPLPSIDEIKQAALDGLNAHVRLQEYSLRNEWDQALHNTSADDPVLVLNADTLEASYYIVPFVHNDTKIIQVAVRTTATDNPVYIQAVATSVPGQAVITLKNEQEALGFIDGQKFTYKGRTTVVSLSQVDNMRPLVWKPCVESFSPFSPFYRFPASSLEAGESIVIYTRAFDGKPFVELRDDVAGA